MKNQPINDVKWIHRDNLNPNLYNPNRVAQPEMELLKQSIESDGWLFPILVFDKEIHIDGLTDNEAKDRYTIIDGFHRYTVSGDKRIYKLTEGFVPCIVIKPENPLATTVRMNRAKGTHAVLKMADIVENEIKAGKSVEAIMKDFGMERDEVERLANSKGIHKSKMITEGDWSKSWIPK